MFIRNAFIPHFWGQKVGTGPFKSLFNFRRIWVLAVTLISFVSLVPLLTIFLADYNLARQAAESEARLQTARLTSNARRSISYYLEERKSALEFITREHPLEDLSDTAHLAAMLENLKNAFGGFIDLGVVDSRGIQRTYAGPYNLQGKDYSGRESFAKAMTQGAHISEVFMGYRNVPHLVITVRHEDPTGRSYLLRATLDTNKFNDLAALDLIADGDSFIINHTGVLQTPSRHHGETLSEIPLPVPPFSEKTQVTKTTSENGRPLVVGYAYIKNSPFILMIVKPETVLLKAWYESRLSLIWFLGVSMIIIMVVILGMSTYLVNRIFIADQTRVNALHQVEHTNKLASIGRLAAGVAHEINNPLAVINEKTGLIKDLLTYTNEYSKSERLLELLDSVLYSVERCGKITKRLLGFARHMDVSIEKVNIEKIMNEVLGFLGKEAEYRDITVTLDIADDIPEFESDRGKLQQIFLNLINNAFAAMQNGGHLDITARLADENSVAVSVKDDGCGIPSEDIKKIFEPFFSTKAKSGGTGLGLSISYGIVNKLGGSIAVDSEMGKGTTFVITLPLEHKDTENKQNASTLSRR